MPVKSKAQAAYMGAVISGKARKGNGPSVAQAKEATRGVRVAKLPVRAARKGGK
jgi:hypothetical protein